MNGPSDLDHRVDRLEAYEAIRQLSARHAVLLDARDISALTDLYVADVRVPNGGVGRSALATWFQEGLAPFGVTFHLVGGHVIDLDEEDQTRAAGSVSVRQELEYGDRWMVVAAIEEDTYRRVEGRWLIESRATHAFYGADLREHPLRVDDRWDFRDPPPGATRDLPDRWASWRATWGEPDAEPGRG